jgi:tetratricopeptide (TPR) repeat protein
MAYQPELERLERRFQEDPARNFAQLAEAYRKDGRHDDALIILREHLASRPTYVSGLIVLGRCLLDQKNDPEARETFERVLAIDAEHILALRALGEIAERTGDVASARQWYTRLLEIDPMNDEAQAALERLRYAPLAVAEPEPPPEPPVEAVEAVQTAEAVETVEAAEQVAEPPGEDTEALPEPWAPPAPAVPPEREAQRALQDAEAAWAGFGDVPVREDAARAEEAPEVPESPPAVEEAASVFPDEPRTRLADFVIERPSTEYTIDLPPLEPSPTDEAPEPETGGPEAAAIESSSDAAAAPPEEELAEKEPAAAGSGGGEDSRDESFPVWEEQDLGRDATAEEAPAGGEGLEFAPFDESLGWDAGERLSHEISPEDLAEAEELHEESLEAPVQELPGLERVDLPSEEEMELAGRASVDGLEIVEADAEVVPVPGFQTHRLDEPEPVDADLPAEGRTGVPEAPEEAVSAAEPATGERPPMEERGSLVGLPVFLPEEETEGPLEVEAEPEPVVTETMAELYVRQGLLPEARETYLKLLAARPGDRRLAARLAELEAGLRRPADRVLQYAAATTGGQTARAFLAEVLSSRPEATVGGDGSGVAPVSEPAVVEEPEPVREPGPMEEPEPMEEAFAEESGEVLGAPTQRAEDEVSLAAVFGDAAPTPEAPPAPAEAEDQAGRPPGGFTFDEFFGKPSTPAPAERSDHPARDAVADDEGDEAFRDWLKGLKS